MHQNLTLSVSSCTYKNGIFQGFSRLQQSDEFVDMTLAAEGYLVKVHQTLVALASPYLKNMLLSIPCQHPVIFLSGISHEVLGFILEYIYTGEVEIPAEKVQTFLKAARAMHISGLKNAIPSANDENSNEVKQTNHLFQKSQQPHIAKPVTIQSNINSDLQLQEHVTESVDIKSEPENMTDILLPFSINIPTEQVFQKPQQPHIAKPVTIQSNINSDLQLQEHVTESVDIKSEPENMTDILLPFSINIPTEQVFQKPQPLPLPPAKPFVTIQNCQILLPNAKSETENVTGSKLPSRFDIPVPKDVFQKPQQTGTSSNPIFTIQNDNKFDIELQEPVVDISGTDNQAGSPLPFSMDIPTSVEGSNEYENIRNINACGKSINRSYDVDDDNDNNCQKRVAKIEIISDVIVQEPLSELKERNDQTPLNLTVPISSGGKKRLKNFRKTNTCGKSINISYNNDISVDNNSQKPVANIEIVSNILPNESMNAINDQGLPKLYADAIASMNKEMENDISTGGSVSQSEQDISDKLNAQQSNPMSEPAESDNMDVETSETDSVLYTASSRGALQLILNKYMYYCHYQRNNGHKRRWRCIDYRDSHCPAAVDTKGEQIVNKKPKHSHPNHDEKIRKKIVDKEAKIFSTIKMAEDTLRKSNAS